MCAKHNAMQTTNDSCTNCNHRNGKRRYTKWVVLWSLWLAGALPPATPPLRLHSGAELRGRLAPDGSHARYFGIPYATVRREHRFKAPGPAPAWDGVFEAVDENVRCAQSWWGVVVGVEDCLRLNVYVPVQEPPSPLPVMVFIHGGGYFEGSGSRLLYGPDYLVQKGVILITFNYRLSAPGFLCLGTKEIPGNAGLKDQVVALKWVQMNIAAFGGDPDNVTIFGESAGAASVSFHMLSNMSKGLFKKAIIQSGSSLSPWALQFSMTDTHAVAVALAKHVGHAVDINDSKRLTSILMNMTIEELLANSPGLKNGKLTLEYLPYVPCLENELDGVEAFITEHPFDILLRGNYTKVPVIIGSNDQEGYYFASLMADLTMTESDFEHKFPKGLHFPTDEEKKKPAEEVKKEYIGDDELKETSILKLSRFYGEAYFMYPVMAETEMQARTSSSPVYSYRLQHTGWRNFAKLWSGPRYWGAVGATHADDLFYLFSMFPVPTLFEHDMINTMTTMWTNFAKHGEPASSALWPAVEARAPQTLRITSPRALHLAPLWDVPRARLWHNIYARYGRKPRD